MNCDDVFDHLTSLRPAATANGTLAHHLKECDACRCAAARFGAAAALFENDGEKFGPIADDTLWQRLHESGAIAEEAASQLRARPLWQRLRPALYAAALLLFGGLLGAALRGGADGPSPGSPTPAIIAIRPADCQLLAAFWRQASEAALCPTCRSPIEKPQSQVVALCAVCHVSVQAAGQSRSAAPQPQIGPGALLGGALLGGMASPAQPG